MELLDYSIITADSLYEKGQYDRALKHYQTALSEDSDNTALALNVGKTHLAMGNRAEARPFIEKAKKSGNVIVHADAFLHMAILNYREGNYSEAAADGEEAMFSLWGRTVNEQFRPEDGVMQEMYAQGCYWSGLSYFECEDYLCAGTNLGLYHRFTKEDTDILANIRQARALIQSYRTDMAETLVKKEWDRIDSAPEHAMELGNMYEELADSLYHFHHKYGTAKHYRNMALSSYITVLAENKDDITDKDVIQKKVESLMLVLG